MKRAAVLALLVAADCNSCRPMPPYAVDLAAAVEMGPVLAATGAPCAKAADCAGRQPLCVTRANGVDWPDGYCTSACDPQGSAPCPDDGLCLGDTGRGRCYGPCSRGSCERAGYACFGDVCFPRALSECNPVDAGSCPQDGGADGATRRVCISAGGGGDDVGYCRSTCDPFRQDCPADVQQGAQACYYLSGFGGLCYGIYVGGKDGEACMYLNSCDAGLMCHGETMGNVCRPYCGGPDGVPCTNGRKCVPITGMPGPGMVGVCSG